MPKNLEEASIATLQQRLVEETVAQQRLQEELKGALESERNLRLENDLLWTYLQRKYPTRVNDAADLLLRLAEGADLAIELQNTTGPKNRTLRQRVRGRLGNLPGVHWAYHGIKNIGK